MVLELVQVIIGALLFFAAGYAISLVIFRQGSLDTIERAAYSLAFSLTAPALILFFINYALGFKVFQTLYVYLVYLAIIGGSLAYQHFSQPTKGGKGNSLKLLGLGK